MAIFTKCGKEITKEFIAEQLQKSDAWLYRSIVAIYKWQTRMKKRRRARHTTTVAVSVALTHTSFHPSLNRSRLVVSSRPSKRKSLVRK